MPASARAITTQDLVSVEHYAKTRAERRRAMLPVKKLRRVDVGPHASFYFENYDTMLLQVQEMLFVEKGGEAQIADELRAYNPLIPQGDELVATLMFEIEDPVRRGNVLRQLTGVEEAVMLDIAGTRVRAVPEGDIERTAEDGKTSSVHFVHFPIPKPLRAQFKDPSTIVSLGFAHAHYGHWAILADATRDELAKDFS
jgi:hypothetical protein